MATIVAIQLDVHEVEGALSGSSRAIRCVGAPGAATVVAARGPAPDLVALGGDAAAAADVAEALIDEPRLLRTAIVAWGTHGSIAEMSRLLALGVTVIEEGEGAFRTACEEALDASEGRTIRVDAATEVQAPPEGVDGEIDLHGRRVVVADDDPATAWYFGDILRARGCDVEEASDGEAALDRARRTGPDLVISDLRMPRMDGGRLCRALRMDPVLGDVPVVLLSWKEDWLHQAADARLAASAYLCKRSTPEEVLACVSDVLMPHIRLERRVRTMEAVRGRLDEAGPYRLLRLACACRPDARLTLQCHAHAYDVRVRDGAPRSATRVGRDGSVVRGSAALAFLLDERSGRFTLDVERAPVDPDLTGSLHQQIAGCVAQSRRGDLVVEQALVSSPMPPAPTAPVLAPAVVHAQPAPHVLAMAPSSAPRLAIAHPVVLAPRVAERTAPLVRSVAPPPAPAIASAAASEPPRARESTRSLSIRVRWPSKESLRWVGIAAVAALGLVLGAGARALRQPPPKTVAPTAQAR